MLNMDWLLVVSKIYALGHTLHIAGNMMVIYDITYCMKYGINI